MRHHDGEPLALRSGPVRRARLLPLRYVAHVTTRGMAFRVELPDAPGCTATAMGREAAIEEAAGMLSAWLCSQLESGGVLLRPAGHRLPHGCECTRIYPAPRVALAVSLRLLRQENAWSHAELALRTGLSPREAAALEDPRREIAPATVAKATRAVCSLSSAAR